MADKKIFDTLVGTPAPFSYKLQAKYPLDTRTVVDLESDLDLLVSEGGAYEGMMVYVKEKKAIYQFNGIDDWVKVEITDTVYTLPAAGEELGGVRSGGSVKIEDGLIYVNPSSVDFTNHTHNVTAAGAVEESSITPEGSVDISVGSGTTNYTPAGTVSAPTITVTPTTASIHSMDSVGALPGLTHTYSDGRVTLTFSAGELPTQSSTTVVTSIEEATASAPTFTGSGVNLAATFTGTAQSHSHDFTGTEVTSSVSALEMVDSEEVYY